MPATLYWVNGSIPSWQVMLAAHIQGTPYTSKRLRVMSEPRQTRTPEFLAINPRGQAPVWVEPSGVVIRGSMAILLYLESLTPGLLPEDPGARASVLTRIFDMEPLRAAYRPLEQLFAGEDALTPAQRRAAKAAPERVHTELALLERELAHDFIASPTLSLADCVVSPILAYQQRRGLDLSAHPGLLAYTQRMRARADVQAAHPEGWTRVRGKKDLFRLAGGISEV